MRCRSPSHAARSPDHPFQKPFTRGADSHPASACSLPLSLCLMAPLHDVPPLLSARRYGLRVQRFEPAGRYWLRIECFWGERPGLCYGRIVEGAQRQDSEAGKQHGSAHGGLDPLKFGASKRPSPEWHRLLVKRANARGAPLLRPSSVAYTGVQALLGALLPPLKIVGTRTALCLCEALGRDWV